MLAEEREHFSIEFLVEHGAIEVRAVGADFGHDFRQIGRTGSEEGEMLRIRYDVKVGFYR